MPCRAMMLIVLLALLTPLGACDERAPAPAPIGPAAQQRPRVRVTSIASLLPSRTTRVAADERGGAVYWVQETDDGQDMLFGTAPGIPPRALDLSSRRILATLVGDGNGDGDDAGHIQSIAVGPTDRAIYFIFHGWSGPHRTLVALGRFDPTTADVRILADTEALMNATGMGRSIVLARGTVVASGRRIWLWMRHTDRSALFAIDASTVTTRDGVAPFPLPPPIDHVRGDARPLDLTRADQRLATGPDGSLLLLDPTDAAPALHRIEPAGTEARHVASLVGLPRALSAPSYDAAGRPVVFAGDAATIERAIPDPDDPMPMTAAWPALVFFDGAAGRREVIDRTAFEARRGLPVHAMRLQQLVPAGRNVWIGYDEASGELVRIEAAL